MRDDPTIMSVRVRASTVHIDAPEADGTLAWEKITIAVVEAGGETGLGYHLEGFHDHFRIEAMSFDGASVSREGSIAPDLTRPGKGLTLTFTIPEADAYVV